MTSQPKPTELLYAVWVPREGWLRAGESIFADHRPEVAASAASFIPSARVQIIDTDALPRLEGRFLAEEQKALDAKAAADATMPRQTWLHKTVGIFFPSLRLKG